MLRDNTMITQAILGYFRICYCIIRHMCYNEIKRIESIVEESGFPDSQRSFASYCRGEISAFRRRWFFKADAAHKGTGVHRLPCVLLFRIFHLFFIGGRFMKLQIFSRALFTNRTPPLILYVAD